MRNKETRLVKQQLKHLRKAELKMLRYRPDSKPGFGGEFIRSKVPTKLLSMLETAFEKGFFYIFDKGTTLIEGSGNLVGV